MTQEMPNPEPFTKGIELMFGKPVPDPAFDEANRLYAAELFTQGIQTSQPFRVLLDHAEKQARDALYALVDVDPTDWRAVANLQNQVRAARLIGQIIESQVRLARREPHRKRAEPER